MARRYFWRGFSPTDQKPRSNSMAPRVHVGPRLIPGQLSWFGFTSEFQFGLGFPLFQPLLPKVDSSRESTIGTIRNSAANTLLLFKESFLTHCLRPWHSVCISHAQ